MIRFRLIYRSVATTGLCWLLTVLTLRAQTPASSTTATKTDTIRASLPDLEAQFLARNYQLLAQRYQINIAGAALITAGLRPNPNLFFVQTFYNPNTHQFFPYGKNSDADLAAGQYNKGAFVVQLQQLILLAGKRSKLIQLAESNQALAQIAFRDVLRNLRYQLYSTYADLYFDLQAINLFREEAARQVRLINAYRIAQRTGGVAPYEVTRLEVALRDLRANIADYQRQIADEQSTLRVLLRQGQNIFYLPTQLTVTASPLPPLATALDSALTNRPDIALSREQINNAQRSLTLEKARRTPDLTLGAYYERYSNAFTNYTALQAQIDLPVRNRNQGNIRAAELQLENVGRGGENQQSVVQNDVLNAYDKLRAYYDQDASRPADYMARIENVSEEATRAYNARVIGLLDYLDKIRTYQQAQLNNINLQNNLFKTQQLFDFVTNTRFF